MICTRQSSVLKCNLWVDTLGGLTFIDSGGGSGREIINRYNMFDNIVSYYCFSGGRPVKRCRSCLMRPIDQCTGQTHLKQ